MSDKGWFKLDSNRWVLNVFGGRLFIHYLTISKNYETYIRGEFHKTYETLEEAQREVIIAYEKQLKDTLENIKVAKNLWTVDGVSVPPGECWLRFIKKEISKIITAEDLVYIHPIFLIKKNGTWQLANSDETKKIKSIKIISILGEVLTYQDISGTNEGALIKKELGLDP